ncbi:hypothetical protein LJB84_00635 [Bacteroidales bacterium OttesenSCG-928-J19]|nr:hypothetical protein [Bacteroidales bacterium OttesenSCG-928-J19]
MVRDYLQAGQCGGTVKVFEINIFDEKSGTREMLLYMLKEEQDIKQEYLKEQGEALKNYCKKLIVQAKIDQLKEK